MNGLLNDIKVGCRALRRAPGTGALTTALGAALIGVRPLDPATFGGAVLLLLACAAAAGHFPARRAARLDPLATLRSE